ncbi:Yip1 family protein [Allostreptomyces psammosilenae]|uniref:Yip1 domain-containing protein n=1 Tax=Allostreptomyces psammosilenae TaxID=1892865 RepID=A0A852ZSF3_9ACTN|nr:Yip1 family protein [Allostreptomyces psammosilenae]NYI05269.1 hypothetical protein [Allostreptomyces psammosilenae]
MAGNGHPPRRGADPRGGGQYGAPGGYGQPGHGAGGYGQGGPAPAPGYGGPDTPAGAPGYDPRHDRPGNTRAWEAAEAPPGFPGAPAPAPGGHGDPYGPPGQGGYGQPGYGQPGYGQGGYDQNAGYGYDQGGYDQGYDDGTTYRAGRAAATGPKPTWQQLLTGIFLRPVATFEAVRGHQVWVPTLVVSAIYGVLGLFGIEDSREQLFSSTLTTAITTLLGGVIGFCLAALALGSVTHAVARQFQGDGGWATTVGLATLIAWLSDLPRLAVALFVPADNMVVQILGWASWALCAALMTAMVNRVHDLPWARALGASAIQLLALLVLIKLPLLTS